MFKRKDKETFIKRFIAKSEDYNKIRIAEDILNTKAEFDPDERIWTVTFESRIDNWFQDKRFELMVRFVNAAIKTYMETRSE